MQQHHKLLSAIVIGWSAFGAVAQADVNAVVEGSYAAECEKITFTAGIFETSCASNPNSLICGAEWVGTPYTLVVDNCATGAAKTFSEVYSECRDQSELVLVADGQTIDVEHDICLAAASAYSQLVPELEGLVNGEFSIDVAGSTWISNMTGSFESDSGATLDLTYATANAPWSNTFGFATMVPVGSSLSTAACDNTSVLLSASSDGNVRKSTGVLTLDYNVNGTLNCDLGGGDFWTATVNMHVDVAGQKL